MTLTRVKIERFTAFEQIEIELSPNINVFIGENGTGKTHLLKVVYAACDVSKTKGSFSAKLLATFLPFDRRLGRLVYRTPKSTRCNIEVHRGRTRLKLGFSNHAQDPGDAKILGKERWIGSPIESAFIPVKEMLANAPGFRGLYGLRDIEFEEVYADILDRAFRPVLRGTPDARRRKLLKILQRDIEGRVIRKEERFFLKNRQGELEFTLLAEGMRKLALLWLLIQNGTLLEGSVLFWDEPEANINPSRVRTLIDILLELSRGGVQIFLATHDYVLLKELDLQMKPGDEVRFHSLYRDRHGKLNSSSVDSFLEIHPNAISDTFAELYKRDVDRALGES